MKKTKWSILLLSCILAITLTGCAKQASESAQDLTVNIGFIKTMSPAYLAKEKGFIEQQFAAKGAKINWVEFQTGPEEFEALSANHIDFLACGNTPVIVAQSAGIDFKVISMYSTGLKNNVLLVPKDSPIKTIQELKDKKIAVAKGSTSYNLIYRTLDQAGLQPSDVKLIHLAPSEAKPAFENNTVDVWGIWEPFISTEQANVGARILVSGDDLKMPSPNFNITSTKFAKEHPEFVELYLKALDEAVSWQSNNANEAIELYSKVLKLEKSIVANIANNTDFRNDPVSDEYIKEQQKTADTLQLLGGVKNKLDAAKVIDNTFINNVKKDTKN
ncbi:aliphatic sulfonate ABC transporter substrate-binding protein [Paenibacillus sp. sgz302251]|uniref:aliphatic sulfonate ABC transporter substrate-binding protein n=1 Tax=Paenibacillus sp. sgz302251 TaxID=3414493 RepID=UPI003C7DD79A